MIHCGRAYRRFFRPGQTWPSFKKPRRVDTSEASTPALCLFFFAQATHKQMSKQWKRTRKRTQASTTSLKDDPGTPEECNLFVGDLARNLTEEKLEKAFEQHGRVSYSAGGGGGWTYTWTFSTRGCVLCPGPLMTPWSCLCHCCMYPPDCLCLRVFVKPRLLESGKKKRKSRSMCTCSCPREETTDRQTDRQTNRTQQQQNSCGINDVLGADVSLLALAVRLLACWCRLCVSVPPLFPLGG